MRRSFNRFKPDGRGWHQDYGRHQEAAKYGRASEKIGTWSSEIAPARFLERNYPWLTKEGRDSMKSRHTVKDTATEEAPTKFLSRWYPYLPENIRGTPKEKEALIGGVADRVPDEAFDEGQLMEGAQTEMKEHTTDPKVAKEIAKDHLAETGKWSGGKLKSNYYNELQRMEGNLQ